MFKLWPTRYSEIFHHRPFDQWQVTIADRLLELTHTVEARNMQEQVLDEMDLERNGAHHQAHPVTMYYEAEDGLPTK